MLKIASVGRLDLPSVYCDECGELIAHHDEGMVQVFRNGQIRIVHALSARPDCDRRDNDGGSLGLAHFLINLEANLGLTGEERAQAVIAARMLNSV